MIKVRLTNGIVVDFDTPEEAAVFVRAFETETAAQMAEPVVFAPPTEPLREVSESVVAALHGPIDRMFEEAGHAAELAAESIATDALKLVDLSARDVEPVMKDIDIARVRRIIVEAFKNNRGASVPMVAKIGFGVSTGRTCAATRMMIKQLVVDGILKPSGIGFAPTGVELPQTG